MAGHSKFKNIMHRKGAQDKKRAKVFTKLIKELTVAAKSGLPDPEHNPRLRSAIAAAQAANMPKDNVERAIKKATGADGDVNYEEVRYEGYGPGGAAIIVECLSDNRNRTASTVRASFTKYGGNLGETGSVSFMFERIGQIVFAPEAGNGETVFEAALEAGASDVESTPEGHFISCDPDQLMNVRDALEKVLGHQPTQAELTWDPKTTTPLDEEKAVTMLKLIDALEDNDDVQNVFSNYDVTEDVLKKIAGE